MPCLRNLPTEAKLTVDPADNILIGAKEICAYLRIKSNTSFIMYVELYGLPAIKRMDGRWMSSMTAIDQWMFLCSEEDLGNRNYSRAGDKAGGKYLAALKRRKDRVSKDALRLAEIRAAWHEIHPEQVPWKPRGNYVDS